MQYIDGFAHPYMGFLTVYGDSNETIKFRIYNHTTGKIYHAKEQRYDYGHAPRLHPGEAHRTAETLTLLRVYCA
jgi:hypothetical protein